MFVLDRRPGIEDLKVRGDVDGLTKKLHRGDVGVRQRAAKALGEVGGERALHALIKSLNDANLLVRDAAATSLAKVGTSVAVPALALALKDRQRSVREKAARALGRIGDASAIPHLSAAMRDENEDVRVAAIMALKDIGTEDAVEELIDGLQDGRLRFRCTLALGLVGPGARNAVPYLIELATVRGSQVRDVAIQSLKLIGADAREAIPVLGRMLHDSSEDWDIRYEAFEALERIVGNTGVPADKRPFMDIREMSLVDRIVELVHRAKNLARTRRGVTLQGTPANHWFQLCGVHLTIIGEHLYDAEDEDLMEQIYREACEKGQFRGRYLDSMWREVRPDWKVNPEPVSVEVPAVVATAAA